MTRAICKLLILIAFAANCVYFLVACQPKKGTQSSDTHGPVVAPVPGMPDSKGTSDQGGGGNLINGKPLDFYKKDVTELPEYIKYIKPIDEKLNDIREDTQGDNGVTYLETSAKRKTWYVVPVKLDTLETARIGTNFKSDQGAYQTEKEIFISDLIYKDLDEEHKAQLLLHEIVMAFYLVKYEDGKFYCEAFKKPSVRENCNSSIAELNLKNEFKPEQRKGKFLEADEYESIRHVTEWLFNQSKSITKVSFEEKMLEKNFDSRVFNKRNVVTSQRNETIRYPIKDLLRAIERQQLTNQQLTYCGFDFSKNIAVAKNRCSVAYKVEGKNLIMTVQSDKDHNEKIGLQLPYHSFNGKGEQDQSVYMYKVGFKNGTVLYRIWLDEYIPDGHGQTSRSAILWLKQTTSTEYNIIAARIKKTVWLKKPDSDNSYVGEDVKVPPEEDIFRLIYGEQETDISIHDLN